MREIDIRFAALAWWPVLWHGAGLAVVLSVPTVAAWWCAAVWVLILPPVLCRAVAWKWPLLGTYQATSGRALLWWWQQQLQMPFNRFPWFEEALRLVPGVYQTWLTLWGSRVSWWCAFAPGAVVTDRQLLRIARGAIIGNGCLLGGHLVMRDGDGWAVAVAPLVIETGAIVGARCVLGPGSSVAAREQVTAAQPLPPFQRWEGGRRHRPPHV